LHWLRRKRKLDQYALLEWSINDTLQLHRLAHEELGYGNWRNCADAVPLTEKGELLAMVDLDDMNHPKLLARIQTKTYISLGDSDKAGEVQTHDIGEEIQEIQVKSRTPSPN